MLRLFESVTLLLTIVHSVWSSFGDRSEDYQKCLDICFRSNCSTEMDLQKFYDQLPSDLRITFWTCESECKYQCMWLVVEKFSASYGFVPQFYGKWPFLRYHGLQEPASVLFSLFNLLSCIYMFVKFYWNLLEPRSLRFVWLTYTMIAMITWIFSSIFHTRDFDWTEKLDYFFAFLSVLFGFYACLMRLIPDGNVWKFYLFGFIFGSYFVCHVSYLTFFRFDYGYNMKANVLVGILNSCSWLIWCLNEFVRRKNKYVWRCALVITAACCLLTLEVLDFPPILWIFDAHSLWHLGTSPLPLLWTKYVFVWYLKFPERTFGMKNIFADFDFSSNRFMGSQIFDLKIFESVHERKDTEPKMDLRKSALQTFFIFWIVFGAIPIFLIVFLALFVLFWIIFWFIIVLGMVLIITLCLICTFLMASALAALWFAAVYYFFALSVKYLKTPKKKISSIHAHLD